jgi:small multidrug resistance pump
MLACYFAGFIPLALALKKIDVSVAYAVWSALGTTLAVSIGILWFKEPATAMKFVSLALIITGLIFLNLSADVGQ